MKPAKYLIPAVGLTLTLLVIFAQIVRMFSVLPYYDDEGYVLISIKHFVEGKILYDQIYTQYGPAFYLYESVVHGFLGVPVTHFATRLLSVAHFIIVLFLLSHAAYKAFKNPLLTILIIPLIGRSLSLFSQEPGHPQELVAVVISLIFWLITVRPLRIGQRSVCVGILLGVLALTKINVGIYISLAASFFLLAQYNKWNVIRCLAFPTALLPFVLMRSHFSAFWGYVLALIFFVSIFSTLERIAQRREQIEPCLSFVPLVVGIVTTIALILSWIISLGSAPESLLNSLLIQPSSFPKKFWLAVPYQSSSLFLAILALVIYLAHRCFTKQIRILRTVVPIWATFLIALSIYYLTTLTHPLLNFSPLLFLWATLSYAQGSFGLLSVLFTAFFPLQAYPVAGSQAVLGLLFLSTVFLSTLSSFLEQHLPNYKKLAVISLVILLLGFQARLTFQLTTFYLNGQPLELQGTDYIRLPPKQVTEYRAITEYAKQFDTVLTYPTISSLYLWADRPAHPLVSVHNWALLLTEAQQNVALDYFKSVKNLGGIIFTPYVTPIWKYPQELERGPLLDYLANDFEEASSVGQYKMLRRKH